MAEKDTGVPDEKSLELPSLFGRKKKRSKDVPAEEPRPDETAVIPAVEEPVAPPPAPAAPPAAAPPAAAPPAPAPSEPAVEQPTEVVPPVPAAEPSRAHEHTPVAPESEPLPPTTTEPVPAGGARKAKAPRPPRQAPSIPATLAALVVGALIGLLGVGLTFGALQACDAITGTDSCGGPGLLIVLVVVIVMIMAGSALLRLLGVGEPGGLSFLGVAIFVAICLVFLVQQLLEPWMVVVGPVLCALSFGTAHWVVNRFNTELLAEDEPEPHDVR